MGHTTGAHPPLAVLLAQLRRVGDPVDLLVDVGELAQGRALDERRPVGTATHHPGLAVRPAGRVAAGAVVLEQGLAVRAVLSRLGPGLVRNSSLPFWTARWSNHFVPRSQPPPASRAGSCSQ